MCSHLTISGPEVKSFDPVLVLGCSKAKAEETGCSATFGKRPWLGIGNDYFIEKVATFRDDEALEAFRDHLDAFLDKLQVKREAQ